MANKFDILFEIDGLECTPKNWQEISVSCAFDEQVQPVIITDEFIFVNEDAKRINEWFTSRPFEGMPFTIQFNNGLQTYTKTGCLDFAEYEIVSEIEIKCKIKLDDGLDLVDEQLRAVSFGYLAREGGILSQSDYIGVPTVIRKKFDGLEVAMASLTLYFIYQDLKNGEKTLKEGIIKKIKVVLDAPASKPAEIFEKIGMAIILIAYYALMLIALYRLIRVMQENLLPIKTTYKGITERKALEKACEHLGLTLDCDIPELDFTVYMPSKTDNRIRKNRKDEGIPNVSDFGYQLSEMFELILKKYNARTKKKGDTLIIRADKSDFWFSDSTYVMPSVLAESFKFNVSDMKANHIISFQYDSSDEWTMPNSRQRPLDNNDKDFESKQHDKGVAFEVILDIPTYANQKYKQNRGLTEVRIPQALGQRKNTLSALEISMKALFLVVDLTIKLFGGKTIGQKINEHKGHLIISQPSFNIPKSIPLMNGLIPSNSRGILGATRLYNEYHWTKSFKQNSSIAQKKVYTDIKIPFDLSNFMSIIDNSYFTTEDGQKGKFTKLEWTLDKDFATASFWIANQYIDPNSLTEINIES